MHGVADGKRQREKKKAARNSESVDNYLKAILTLGGVEESRVTGNSLAAALGVAPASVTNMLQKLAAAPHTLVKYERHRGVRLSKTGKRRALEVIRHHRLIETFLYEVLDYPIEEVHEEAERLEHFISERFEERISAKLGHPTIDPHGHSIPTVDGEMPHQSSILLNQVGLDGGQSGSFIIDSISDRHPAILRSLKASGMTPGARLRVTRTSKPDGYSIRVGRSAKPLDLSLEMAGELRILPVAK